MKRTTDSKHEQHESNASNLRVQFMAIPEPLQRQVMIRIGFSMLSLFMIAPIVIFTADLLLVVPFVISFILCGFSAIMLFRLAVEKKYVVISGRCIDITLTMVRRQVKSITIETDSHIVQVTLGSRLKRFLPDMELDVYIADSTPVYHKDGMELLSSYIAIDVKGGKK